MRVIFSEIFVRIYAPLHSLFMRAMAYGPWGPFHQPIIKAFAACFKIPIPPSQHFKNLGAFFLRDLPFHDSGATLVSPVECDLLDGPSLCSDKAQTTVKGLRYQWSSFPELDPVLVSKATYWNLYLAPRHYHWVHAPSEGINLEAIYFPGKKYPVNGFGRWLCSRLYLENDRLSFRWTHPELGRVVMMCVGAMGVSSLYSALGPVSAGQWTPLSPNLGRLQKLLGFKLGSTVILVVEKRPPSMSSQRLLKVGDAL